MINMEANNESNLNDSNKALIDSLRANFEDLLPGDFTDFDFLRWLQGHDFRLELVVPKLRHHLRLLKSYDFVRQASANPANPIMDKHWPKGMLEVTTGKDDNFVYIECIGVADGEGVLKCVPIHGFLLNVFAYLQNETMTRIRTRERRTSRQSGLVVIYDCDKAPMNAATFAILSGPYRLFLQAMLEHYVEVLQKGILVNAPYFVQLIWRIISPILPEKTKQKFMIFGADWKKDLLKHIDPNSLPVHWGGNLVDPTDNDPKYPSRIVVPCKVPPELYWTPSDDDPKPEDMQILYVSAGKTEIVTVEVNEPNSILSWYFTVDTDFGFGVFYTEKNANDDNVDDMDMVYPQFKQIPGPSVTPESDRIKCTRIGFYKLWFGNEKSWIRKLKVQYLYRIQADQYVTHGNC